MFEWLGLKKKDDLHRLVAGKYLKQLLQLHEQGGTLDIRKDQVDQLCKTCLLPDVCKTWDKEGELTCFLPRECFSDQAIDCSDGKNLNNDKEPIRHSPGTH